MFTEAAEDYRQLVADYPDKPELNYYLADAYTQAGELGKAIDAYDALEDAIGASEALSMLKYKLYNQLNKPKEAYREIEKLSEKYPMDPHYQLVLGDLHLQRKEMKEAFACYQKAHDIDPNSPYYIVSMANYYEAAGDTEKAEEEIRSALNNDELDIDTKTDILQRFTLQLQQSKKDLDGVYALFGSLLEKHPENSDLRLLYGALLMSQNKIADAKYQYQVVTETTPDRAEGWQQLLNIALKSDSLNEVSRICKRCIELFPTSPEYYFYLGIVYYQQNNFQESLNTYKKGLTVVPADNIQLKSDFYGQMGDIYHQINLPDSAYAAYDEALKFNEQNVAVLNNYSYFLSLDKKDLKKAERMSAVCIKMEPDNATYLDTYAWIFFVQGSYSLAKIYIESALQKDTTHSSELVDHYGDILFMNGDKAKAVEQWKKAREMGKKSEVLDKKIASEAYIEDKNAK
jgi:tetratricopeptide (TPR) repeat protein